MTSRQKISEKTPGHSVVRPSDRSLSRGADGFALIATISVMVLLVMISLAMLSLSSISVRAESQEEASAEARANARLALMLAIGQLQSELGPDQRINAAADLLDSSLTDSRKRWVGTWDSWPGSSEQRPDPQFRRWLVSGNPELLNDPSFPNTATDLISLNGDQSTVDLSAPKVLLAQGGLAYAVIDENAKARLGSSLEPELEDTADHLSRWQSPPAGHGAIPGLEAVPRTDAKLDLIASGQSVDLIPLSETGDVKEPSSYTVWSEGLLTDVRNGGLRKDLSLYLQQPESADSNMALYEYGSRRGINFKELHVFHELSTRLSYDAASFTHPDGGSLNSSIPCLVGEADKTAAATDTFFPYLRPVILRASWYISAYTRNEGSVEDPSYRVYVVLEPILWLWNPFDANLIMQPGGHLTSRCWGLPYDFTIKAGNTTKTVHFNDISPEYGSNISMETGQNEPVVMRPGEVQIFSRGRQATTPSEAFGSFEGKLGWSGTGGFSLDTGIVVDDSSSISIAMSQSSERGANQWGLIEFLSYVGTDTSNLYWNGGLMIDRTSWDDSLSATDFPSEMFNDVPEKTFSSPSDLTVPQPLALFSYLARTEKEGSIKSRYLARLSPASMGFDHQATDPNTLHSLPYEPMMQAINGGLDRDFDYDGGKGYFGASYKADNGQSYLITHSVPRERPISLGSFQHALANGLEITKYNSAKFHNRILQPSITHAIGNSFAPPSIAPDETTGTFNGMPAVDHSWLANDALWDQWFVSSIADRNAPHHTSDQAGSARTLLARLAGLDGDPTPLPNRHYLYAGQDPESDTNEVFDGSSPKSDAHLKVASLLRVHGAFNINSTDPAAWLAMFRSTHGLAVPVERSEDSSVDWESANNPIAGLLMPNGSAVRVEELNDPSMENQWVGFRDPSDDELEELAEAMVEEVRKRGPFLSLSDFVNRRVVSDPELATSGALQSALDRTLNKELESGSRSTGSASSATAFPEAESGSQMTHVPGHVKQGDILTTLGTRFTPRSDTFTVRAYGESRSETGQVLASARCEAVIQRVADYIDPADASHLKPDELVSQVNQQFGRKLRVVAFRWLASNEI
ncbi:hypothetical protein JO972_11585 [Verrucomicrobiaceae bacterium 5K15]|uniref:Uncharacterized protein n=1 Tax=Oceaniferula flava TaxID=2800421 RepID=A0AAE2SD15_9BACT|nr:hypothetical protein [Oceaniferula flavus]MBK1855604.1 hypothetical protein [Oceaniferula flavus]MBM1136910.1 hypothetical protein [Oceaniferula flavus]